MLIRHLHKSLTDQAANKSTIRLIFWLSLSLSFAATYGILAVQKGFSGEYIVQDDARQHVFWMRRFLDAGLFPNDLIADYFQSVAPAGYAALYQLMAAVGIDPVLLSKILPVVLGLITTGYCFGVCLQLLPLPITGFIGALLLNQNLWMQDGLISGTPKAFIYPLFLAFLYYLLRRSLLPCLVTIALTGLFYPSFLFICEGILILQLCHLSKGQLRLSRNRRDYLFCAAGLAVAFCVLLPYAVGTSEFGPVITSAEARTLPEFLPKGRANFFEDSHPWRFWFNASRSGIRLTAALMPPLVYAGLLLPILLRYPSRFPLLQQVRGILLLPQIVVASLGVFFAAHALLFKLHLPSRYTQHTLRIVMVTAAAVTLTLILDAVLGLCAGDRLPRKQGSPLLRQVVAVGTTTLLAAALILYPATHRTFFWTGYVVGEAPTLYRFFQAQPKDIMIASLAEEADNLPTFAQRSILVGGEYAIPYHLGYYRPFRQRTLELIQAEYSLNLADAQALIQKYGVDFWLLNKAAFTAEHIAKNRWLKQYQPAQEAFLRLQQGKMPALASVIQPCTVFETENVVVLGAECIAKIS